MEALREIICGKKLRKFVVKIKLKLNVSYFLLTTFTTCRWAILSIMWDWFQDPL
jgi:hypothetical protein